LLYPSEVAPVLVTRRIDQAELDRLAAAHEVDQWEGAGPIPRDELMERLAVAEGLLCMLTEPIGETELAAAPRLRVVSQMAVGVDNIDIGACRARGIPVGHTPDVLTETTADTAFALLAAAVRRLPEGCAAVREGRWGEWDPDFLLGGDLHGTTLGIVGLGRIGTALALRAAGFRMRLLYTSRARKPQLEGRFGIAYRSLDDLLAEADHVVLTAPLTPATHHLIDERALQRMRPDATLVNVSRGPLVDHHALALALAEGWIGRAALDVTEPEPIPPDHPLVGMANCLIVPHLGSASRTTRGAMARLAVDNLIAGLAGDPMPAPVGPDRQIGQESVPT
jgi:glyoxylate reductase